MSVPKDAMGLVSFGGVTVEDVAVVVGIVDTIIRLAASIYEWIANGGDDVPPISASMTALVVLIESKPAVRAEFLDRMRANPVLVGQMRELAKAHGKTHPALARLMEEVDHAAR